MLRILRTLNRLIVEIKIFTPPSGRLIFLMMRATVPTGCKSKTDGDSASLFSIEMPIKPFSLHAASTTLVSSGALIMSGVNMPGKIGRPASGIKKSLLESACSIGIGGTAESFLELSDTKASRVAARNECCGVENYFAFSVTLMSAPSKLIYVLLNMLNFTKKGK